jgi:Tol biopolymer transport system component
MRYLPLLALFVSACLSKASPFPNEPNISMAETNSGPNETAIPVIVTTDELSRFTPTPKQVPRNRPFAVRIEPGNIITGVHNSCMTYSIGDYFLWSDDSKYLYYDVDYYDECLLEIFVNGWVAYDIEMRSALTMTSPITSYPEIWTNLSVVPPENPELRGLISPSGRYVLYDVFTGGSFQPSAQSIVWFVDLNEKIEAKLMETAYPGHVGRAFWTPDEGMVVFDYGYEGGAGIYVVDVRNKEARNLADISEYEDGTEEPWALSPDGTKVAVVGQDSLYIVSLANGKAERLGEFADGLEWSNDSKKLYFWLGSPDHDPKYQLGKATSLRVYDLVSEKYSTMIDAPILEELAKLMGFMPSFLRFSVSPTGDKVAFKVNELWIVILQ